MHFWVIQTGEPLHCDGDNIRGMRAINASNALVESGHTVTLWSSDFYHQEKRHRNGKSTSIQVSNQLTIQLIPTCGYKKNVSITRFIDHVQLAKEFHKTVGGFELPDAALVGFPPIELALTAVEYLESNGVPVLLDVKDLWPDIFEEAVPSLIQPIARLFLRKLHKQSVLAMSKATGISSMSKSFLEWGTNRCEREIIPSDLICPLTAKNPVVDQKQSEGAIAWWNKLGITPTKNLRFMFVGSLSRQFDLTTVLNAIESSAQGGLNVEAVICGTGDLEFSLRERFGQSGAITFAGWVDYPKYQSLASMSDIAIAPYRSHISFDMSIPNKVIDAFSFSLPIITPIGGEIGALIEDERVGWRYRANSPQSLRSLIKWLLNHPDEIRVSSDNANRVYSKQFDHAVVYQKLVEHLEEFAYRASATPNKV